MMNPASPSDSTSQETLTIDSGVFDSEPSMDSTDTEFLPIVTKEMIEEEEELKKMSKQEMARLRKEYDEEYEKNMVQIRRKRLMNLLDRSRFYSEFISKKISDPKSFQKENRNPKQKRKRGAKFDISDYNSEEIENACKKKICSENDDDKVIKAIDAIKEDIAEEPTRVTELGITVPASQPELLEGCCLRDYQMQGLEWLKLLFEGGMNGILADEMGLGKTAQTIALVCHLYEQRLPGPFLIVAPLSTLPNWVLEFESFAPKIPIVLYHGSKTSRVTLQEKVRKLYRVYGQKVFPVVITSYEVPIMDTNFLSEFTWKYIIVDEGHRLKNYKTLLSRTLKEFKSENRLLLTGTPLQNNLTELWSLLHFLLPEIFDSLDAFQSWFQIEDMEKSDTADKLIEQEQESHVLTLLNKILTPFLLRRVKTDVNLNLPPKKEVHVYCPMSELQYKLYESIVDNSIAMLRNSEKKWEVIPDNKDGTRAKRRTKSKGYGEEIKEEDSCEVNPTKGNVVIVNNGDDQYLINIKMTVPFVMMRKVANHPYLVQMPVYPGSDILRIDRSLITSSGKFSMLDELLKRLKERGHKVLIFSTSTMVLNLLEDMMDMNDYKFERLDGSCKIEDRRSSIRRFNTDPEVFAFLLSTRAGGLGINLTAADTAIIFDSDWNPQVDLQAQDRCHRIGQTRPVIVYRLVTEGTIDERIVTRASAKRKLEKIVIQEGQFKYKLKSKARKDLMDLEELKELLQKKLHSCEIKSSQMSEEEWEQLLDRSSMK